MNNKLKWLWLAEKCGVACSEFTLLLEKFGDIEEIYEADYDIYEYMGISERLCQRMSDKSLAEATKTALLCENRNIGIMTYADEIYPASLRTLKNPPIVLYYAGKLPDLNNKLCIGVVGTRKMSEYGMKAAYKISYEVAAAGAVVVSGMALGIDGIAACAAIKSGGKTVAVLGCGVDVVYPKSHDRLCELIKQNGAVISEFPLSTEPWGANFPIRNRLISGISQGTAVIEADLESGAMITAKNAILHGKDVYAVPGNIDISNSEGTNSLIRDGAQAVLCGNDIIKNYTFMYRDHLSVHRLNQAEKHSELDLGAVAKMGIGIKTAKGGRGSIADGAELNKSAKKDTKTGSAVGDALVTASAEKIERPSDKAENRVGVPSSAERAAADNVKVTQKPRRDGAGKGNEATDAFAPPKKQGDNSAELLAKLNEKQRRVFEEMPLDRAVTVDYLSKTGIPFGEVISALTVLEIKGLVSSLPGALYIRK